MEWTEAMVSPTGRGLSVNRAMSFQCIGGPLDGRLVAVGPDTGASHWTPNGEYLIGLIDNEARLIWQGPPRPRPPNTTDSLGTYERRIGSDGAELVSGTCARCGLPVNEGDDYVIRYSSFNEPGGIFHAKCEPQGAGWYGVQEGGKLMRLLTYLRARFRCWRDGHGIDYSVRQPVQNVSGETIALSVRCMACGDEFYITNRISVLFDA